MRMEEIRVPRRALERFKGEENLWASNEQAEKFKYRRIFRKREWNGGSWGRSRCGEGMKEFEQDEPPRHIY